MRVFVFVMRICVYARVLICVMYDGGMIYGFADAIGLQCDSVCVMAIVWWSCGECKG